MVRWWQWAFFVLDNKKLEIFGNNKKIAKIPKNLLEIGEKIAKLSKPQI
jgi:hypothetical protein